MLVIASEIFLQMINAAFMAILLIHMEKCGFQDHDSANAVSYRFLSVLLLAFPLGLLIKSAAIKPVFYISAICTPIFGLLILEAIEIHDVTLLNVFLMLWGASFTGIQVGVIPYMLRNTPKEIHTEAISLSYSTWSLGSIFSGVLIFGLATYDENLFNERFILQVICVLGFLSIIALLFMGKKEQIPVSTSRKWDLKQFDWKRITKAMAPTLIIATGAGLTIPFISLFFYKIHGLESKYFGLLSSFTTVIVFMSVMLTPKLKAWLGYRRALVNTQTAAIVCLIILASTEYFSGSFLVLIVAMICYIIRQPLMNTAAPLGSDLVMNYVGEKNQEMISALTAGVWSGSWFISSKMFEILRENEIKYSSIFYLTALLYSLGVIMYYKLAKEYESMNN